MKPSPAERHSRARRVIPGGVNSPVRAFKSVGGSPVFIASAKGPYLYDADGNEYIDFVLSWGPMILGHAHPAVVEAVQKAAEKGLSDQVDDREKRLEIFLEKVFFRSNALFEGFDDRFFHVAFR